MSSVTRWDPVHEMTSLHDAMSQLFQQAVMKPEFGRSGVASGVYGAMNVWETPGTYHCQFLLPGVDPEAIELSARQNTLTVHVTVPETLTEEQRKSTSYLVREFGSGEFVRAITFPKDVKGDAIEASYDQGVLTLEIPLAEHAQPRRISVRAGATQKPQVVEEQQRQTSARQPVEVSADSKAQPASLN